MKKSVLLTLLTFFVLFGRAQQVQWLHSSTVSYNLNPQLPVHFIAASGNNIFTGRLDSSTVIFGNEIYGVQTIECFDSLGSLKWNFSLGSSAYISEITADVNGQVFVGGLYMETLHLNGIDSLENTGTGFDTNLFLFSLDSTGTLLWKKNLSLNHPGYSYFPALTIDMNNTCWFSIQDFQTSLVIQVDGTGAEMQVIPVNGTRFTSSISFDANNNMYLAGSTEMGTMTIDTMSVTIPESYMMFIARINSSGSVSWVRLAHDVTFQRPQVVATINGDAFLSGPLLDSTSWGSISFSGPQWVYDFFLTRVDSSGNFFWGVEVPATPSINGDFYPGIGKFIDTDNAGNIYLSGLLRGEVNWGNGVVTNTGIISYEQVAILSFDYNGFARWGITGGSPNVNAAFNVSVVSNNNLYFAIAGQDTITFDSVMTNMGNGYAACFGKIGPSVSTGISVVNQKSRLVYPNPVTGDQLNFENPFNKDFQLEIFDQSGKQVLAQEVKSRLNHTVNIDKLANSLFLFRIIDETGIVYSGRFVVAGR